MKALSTTIYLARHGDYVNPQKIIPYQLPGYPLSPLGISQASKIANQLHSVTLAKIFASPVERALQTAQIIGDKLSAEVIQSELATETKTPLQGLTKAELSKMSPDFPYCIPEHLSGNGEIPEVIYKRMTKLIEQIKRDYKDQKVLIVSHGDPITIYLKAIFESRIPHQMRDFDEGLIRYIPMGGLIEMTFQYPNIPVYKELI